MYLDYAYYGDETIGLFTKCDFAQRAEFSSKQLLKLYEETKKQKAILHDTLMFGQTIIIIPASLRMSVLS